MSAALKSATPPRMTAEAFLTWSAEQPDHPRYELVDGQAVAMAPETLDHGRLKYHLARRLSEALQALGLPCEVLVDSVGVQVDEGEIYIPDVLLLCGDAPAPNERTVKPTVVIEVASPSTQRVDEEYKTLGYFAVASVQHYLIVLPTKRRVIHHERGTDGVILTRLRRDEAIRLDPPGITLSGIFPAA